jgi:N-acetylglutamate synthase-like GNAT family acetyltransferase
MIRAARADDADALARLAGELGYPSTADEMRSRMSQLSDHDAVLVAEDDGVVEAWIHVTIALTLQSGKSALIAGLVVTESRRGSGIGENLVRAAEEWARERNMTKVRVRTNVDRTRTHKFYERCGYTHKKTSRIYEKPL